MKDFNREFLSLMTRKDRDDYEEGYRFRCDYGYLNEHNLNKLIEDGHPSFVKGYRKADGVVKANKFVFG